MQSALPQPEDSVDQGMAWVELVGVYFGRWPSPRNVVCLSKGLALAMGGILEPHSLVHREELPGEHRGPSLVAGVGGFWTLRKTELMWSAPARHRSALHPRPLLLQEHACR